MVYLHNCFFLSETKPLFTFTHPNLAGKESKLLCSDPDGNAHLATIDNSRYSEMEFSIPTTGTMHGFAGFFEAKLYKDINISEFPISP